MYKAGQPFYTQLITQNISGVPVNADSLPTGVMVRNGSDDLSVQIYCINKDAGRYTISGLIPSTYNQYDSVGISMSGYVNTLLGKSYLDFGSLTTTYPQVMMYSGGLDTINIDGVNLRQALTFMGATLVGGTSGVGNTVWFDGLNSSLARLSAIASNGIRTNITLVLP